LDVLAGFLSPGKSPADLGGSGFSPLARSSSGEEACLGTALGFRQFARDIGWPHVVLFGVLANFPMWIAGGLHRLDVAGWFNLDFLIVGILALFLPRAISACLLLIAILVDFLAEISLTYYIAPADILRNAPEIKVMPGWLITQLCVGVLLVLAIACGAFFLPRLRRRYVTAIFLIAFAVACRGVNALEAHWEASHGPHFLLHRAVRDTIERNGWRSERPARSSTRELIWQVREYPSLFGSAEKKGQPSVPMDSAAAAGYRWLDANSPNLHSLPDFVLIVVESWGNSSDPAIRQSLVQPYVSQLGGKFTILQGSVPFHGATISGENRELCGFSGGHRLMVAPATDFLTCLPDKLRGLGFHTIAIHGNPGTFYQRKEWYPRAGFEEIWFKWKLESAGLPDCVGVFKGVCDAAIADWIGKRLERPDPGPRFVYWVTLNSHLPVPNPAALPFLVPCNTESSLAADPALCNWYRLVLNVHQSVSSLAAQNRPRPVIYVIVGDHAPPFSDSNLRDSFDQSAVPYVILLPNEEAAHNRAVLSQSLSRSTSP
jgi:hypothetical protein